MIRLGIWVLRGRPWRYNAILTTACQGHLQSTWLLTIDVDLDHLSEVMFVRFLRCSYSSPHPLCDRLSKYRSLSQYSSGTTENTLAREENSSESVLDQNCWINSFTIWTVFSLYLKMPLPPPASPSSVGLHKRWWQKWSMWVEETLSQAQGKTDVVCASHCDFT